MRIVTALCALLLSILSLSCGDDSVVDPPNTVDPQNSVVFNVTWAPETRVLGATELTSLRSIDSNRFTFTFASGNPTIDGLKQGDIIAVGDYAIRRVRSVQTSGANKVVQTDTCRLTDAITDGEISWDYGIRYTPEFFASGFRKMGVTPAYLSNDSLGAEFEIGSLTHSFSFRFNNESANIVIRTQKKMGGQTVAEFVCDGTLNKFRQKGLIRIKNRKLQQFENRNNQLNADLTLSATAAGSGNELGINVELPIFKFPIPQLPFILFEIKTQVVLNMVVPPDGSTLVKARFIYDADQGFNYVEGSGVTPFSTVRKEQMDKANEPRTGASGAISASWGLGFPRLAISLAGTQTQAWIQAAYLIGGDFTFTPACQQAKARFIGSCGYGLGAFGATISSGTKTLWDKEKVLLKAGQCP